MIVEALHIFFRGMIHIFSGPGVALAFLFGLGMLYRRTHWPFLPSTFLLTSVFAVVLALPFMWMREPFDVGSGQSNVKTVFDYLSWVAMFAFPWYAYRIVKWAVDDPWILTRLRLRRLP